MNYPLTPPTNTKRRLPNSDLKSGTTLTGGSTLGIQLASKDPATMDGLRKQIIQLKSYAKQLEKLIYQRDVELHFIKGLVELEYKASAELRLKQEIEARAKEQRMRVNNEQELGLKEEVRRLDSQLTESAETIGELQTRMRHQSGQILDLERQLQQLKAEHNTRVVSIQQQRQAERVLFHQRESQWQRKAQEAPLCSAQAEGSNQTQRHNLLNRIINLEELIKSHQVNQSSTEDLVKIQRLQNTIRLEKSSSESEINNLKRSIRKMEQLHKTNLEETTRSVRAQLLTKYQSRVNLIPNLKAKISRLLSSLAESRKAIQKHEDNICRNNFAILMDKRTACSRQLVGLVGYHEKRLVSCPASTVPS